MKLFGSLSELVSAIFRRSSPNNTITVQPGSTTANAGNVIVEFPPKTTGTSTLVDTNTSQSLDNKTLNSPTMVTPALGTPASGVMTNVTGLPLTTGTTGVLPADKGGTGVSNNAAATTTRVGAFAKTETLTNITSVTYPTTGTLATLAGTEALSNKSIGTTNTISVKDTGLTVVDNTDPSIEIAFDAAGTTGTRLTLKAQQTTNQTITFPAGTDTLVNLTSTQQLTNKSIVDAGTHIVDSGDNTKKLDFDVAGTTGTTTTLATSQTTNRSITLPDATDTLVGKATSDVLTNKTISGASNTITNVSLTTGVTGTLPLGNGGTNATAISSGIVRSNGTALSGAGTVALGSEVTGQLPTANGGTGQNSTATFPTSGVVVTEAATQTLTSKTLTTPTITSPNLQGMFWNNATPAALSGTTFAATSDFTAFEITSGSGPLSTITNGADGRTIMVTNMSSAAIILTNSLSTTDGIVTGTAADMSLGIGASVLLRYEATAQGSFGASRWYVVGGSAAASSSSGELNVITNPSATTDLSGWTNGTSHTISRVTTGSPLDPTVPTAFTVVASAATTESSTSGDYFSIATMPSALRSKRLKVEFYVVVPSADVWRLSVYAGTTRLSLSTDSSSVTTLPAGFTGKFTAYFDTTTATAYSVNFTKTTRAGSGNDLTFTNLIVGPGIQPQGAVSTDWVSYTPTVAGMGSGTATATAKWRRVGNTMQIKQYTTVSVNGTGSSSVTWSLPSGTTVDTSALPNNAFTNNIRNALGQSLVFDSSTGGIALQEVITNDSTTVQILKTSSTSTYTGADLGTTKTVSFDITVPISEWAGSGVQALAQNNIEYLTNTNTSTSASDTTTFAYNQGGTAFVSVASAGATIKKRVRAQGVFSSGAGKPKLEVSPDGVLWLQAETKFAYLESGSQKYGMRLVAGGTAATDVDVEFGGDGANGAEAWSVYTAWKWRVVVEQPGQAVGFGNVAQSQSGLVQSAGQLLGTNTNDSAATGYVGEYLENNRSSATPTLTVANTAQSWSVDTGNSTFNDAGEVGITLGAGDWDISGIVNFNLAASTILSDASAWIGTAKGNSTTGQVTSKNYNRLNATIATSGFVTLVVPTWRVSISTATTYYLKATATISVSTLTATGNIRARRMR